MVPLARLEPYPMKGEIAFSLHSASGSEAVLTRRLLWAPPQFLFLSQLCRRGESWLSRSLAVCFVLRAIATAGFLYVFH